LGGGEGDFNLCRFPSDKNTGRINQKYADAFNDWINKWGLVEMNPNNRKYTWSNNQGNAILAKLDRVFISTEWEAAFPLVRVTTLSKSISDHNPLLIDSGDNCSVSKKKFIFEKWWLERNDFKDLVRKV
jgi:endonuclease/exonuclease/phosphatase family metal-dependent hydrolase